MIIDYLSLYQFLKKLATPFTKWDAYKNGIIDENGRVLRKRRTIKDPKELSSWTHLDILVANIKKLLSKVPGGSSSIGTYAAALLLLKEQNRVSMIHDDIQLIESLLTENINALNEDAPVNNVGSGNIDGVGVGPQGEPGVFKSKRNKYKSKNLRNVISMDFVGKKND